MAFKSGVSTSTTYKSWSCPVQYRPKCHIHRYLTSTRISADTTLHHLQHAIGCPNRSLNQCAAAVGFPSTYTDLPSHETTKKVPCSICPSAPLDSALCPWGYVVVQRHLRTTYYFSSYLGTMAGLGTSSAPAHPTKPSSWTVTSPSSDMILPSLRVNLQAGMDKLKHRLLQEPSRLPVAWLLLPGSRLSLENLLASPSPQTLAQPCAQPIRESTSSLHRMNTGLETRHDLTPPEFG